MASCSSPTVPVVETTCTGYQWYGETVEDFATTVDRPFQSPTEITIPEDMLRSMMAYQEYPPYDYKRLSPDGLQFAYTAYPDAYLYSWETQIKTHLFTVDEGLVWDSIYTPIWSPDGSRLAFVLGGSACPQNGTGILVITLDPNDLSQSFVEVYDVFVGISGSNESTYPDLFEFETNESIKYSTCSNYNADEDCSELRLEL